MSGRQYAYQKPGLQKVLMSFVAALCLLFSSCIIKSQLKDLLGRQAAMALMTTATDNSKKAVSSHTLGCVVNTPAELWSVATDMTGLDTGLASGALTLFITSAFFVLLGGILLHDRGTRNGFYIDRKIALRALPLFLSHRRLLI